MSKILPNQVYVGLFEIIKNREFYYHSNVGAEYSHFTEKGKEEVIKWIELMAPNMYKLEKDDFDKRAKEMVWSKLKND